MNRIPAPNPEIAARYCRGELPADAADAFEGEFLGNAGYRQYLEEEGLLERYLRRDLSESELEAVEKALLADPQLLEDIERLEAIGEGLEDLQASGTYAPQAAGLRVSAWWTSPQYAAAASIALVGMLAFSGYLFVDNQSLRDEIDSFGDLRIRTVFLETLRSEADEPIEIRPAPAGVSTQLVVDPAYIEGGQFVWFDDYRATVMRNEAGGQPVVFEIDGLPLNDDETVNVTIPDRVLLPGYVYTVELGGRLDEWTPDRDPQPILDFSFEIAEPN